MVLEKSLESPLDCKEIQPVHSKRDQPWDFFGRNDAKAETSALSPPHVKSWLIGKDSDAGRGWGQEKKGTTEDEMAGWHHGVSGREFEWTVGVGDGQGSLVCCNSWGHKELDTTEWLNWTECNRKNKISPHSVQAGTLYRIKWLCHPSVIYAGLRDRKGVHFSWLLNILHDSVHAFRGHWPCLLIFQKLRKTLIVHSVGFPIK